MSYEPYKMDPRLAELFRFHRQTFGSDGDEPRALEEIVAVPRIDYRSYVGEGHMAAATGRFVARIRSSRGNGVRAYVVDLRHGLLEVRTHYDDSATWYGPGRLPLRELGDPNHFGLTLELYRLCELLDVAKDKHGAPVTQYDVSFDTRFIARAFACPEGLGFPAFTAGLGQRLLARWREAPETGVDGELPPAPPNAWYALARRLVPYTDNHRRHQEWIPDATRDETLVWTVGRTTRYASDRFEWSVDYDVEGRDDAREDAAEIVFENGGFGRARIALKSLYGNCRPWGRKTDKLIALTAEEVAEIRTHVVRPFTDTSRVMREVAALPTK